MESPFDIAADLDTPVSAFMKLGAVQARASCSRASRAASGSRAIRSSASARPRRSSSIPTGSRVDGKRRAPADERRPNGCDDARRAGRAPRLQPEIDGMPFDGGLVGTTGYDVVRFFERLPPNAASATACRRPYYVAPESLLVFDHLTRRIALLHAGCESDRQALRTRGRQSAARRPRRAGPARRKLSPAAASMTRARIHRGVARNARRTSTPATSTRSCSRSASRADRSRPVPDLPRPAAAESVAVHVLLRARRPARRRLLARGAGAARGPHARAAADRRHAAARRDARARRRARARAARRSEGERRARHARRSRAQRSRPRRELGLACTSTRTARSSATATSCTS